MIKKKEKKTVVSAYISESDLAEVKGTLQTIKGYSVAHSTICQGFLLSCALIFAFKAKKREFLEYLGSKNDA